MRVASLLLALALLGGCAGERIEFPSEKLAGTREAKYPIPARLVLPAGTGPYPVIILLHGCGGTGGALNGGPSHLSDWASRVTGWGYAAFIPDSFLARNIGSVCAPADQPKVTVTDRSGDVISAALYLRTRPDIDGARIGVIGFSHGGATAARLAIPPAGIAHPGLIRAAVDYYGSCVNPTAYTGVPLLALAGEADDWGNPAATCRRFADAVGPGKPVAVTTYPGVTHAYDNPTIRTRIVNNGHALQYDAAAAEDSIRRTRAFLDQYVRQ